MSIPNEASRSEPLSPEEEASARHNSDESRPDYDWSLTRRDARRLFATLDAARAEAEARFTEGEMREAMMLARRGLAGVHLELSAILARIRAARGPR